MTRRRTLLLILAHVALPTCCFAEQGNKPNLGLGCSFPLKDGNDVRFLCDDALLEDRRRSVYEKYLQGCNEYFGEAACNKEEARRLRDNAEKPLSMINFTETGFDKMRVPEEAFALLLEHWEKHRRNNVSEWYQPGKLPRNNFWAAPTHVTNFLVDGYELMEQTFSAIGKVLEDWTGVELIPSNLYGIRSYYNGTVMTPHVDRYPLVISVIINIDQDVDEPWPLEVVARNGNAVNITMDPGDMVVYEGHSIIHGRPYELKGSFYANAFVSFEPTGRRISRDGTYHGGKQPEGGLPPFIIPGSPEESLWHKEHPDGWKHNNPVNPETRRGVPRAHLAAAVGNMAHLEELALSEPHLFHTPDPNGWLPIHEAARTGQVRAVEYLLAQGADVNAVTSSGDTPLSLVVGQVRHHPIVDLLVRHGGVTAEQL